MRHKPEWTIRQAPQHLKRDHSLQHSIGLFVKTTHITQNARQIG